jgi:hypothetical protein
MLDDHELDIRCSTDEGLFALGPPERLRPRERESCHGPGSNTTELTAMKWSFIISPPLFLARRKETEGYRIAIEMVKVGDANAISSKVVASQA